MIAATNREIRWQLQLAERRRRSEVDVAFAYLDRMIAALEAMHLVNLRAVPASFRPQLFAVNQLLPAHLPPPRWSQRFIRDAIDQCFELQEQLAAARTPAGTGVRAPDEATDATRPPSVPVPASC